jgi:beta-lactamase regulating signal transducer with metallopeptidase domain
MSRLYEIVLINAGLATILALVAEATGRWLHRPALAHCLWVLALLKLLTPPAWTFDVRLPEVATSGPAMMASQIASTISTSQVSPLTLPSPPEGGGEGSRARNLQTGNSTSTLPARRLPVDPRPGDVLTVPASKALAQVGHVENSSHLQSTNWLRLVTWVWLSGTMAIVAVVGYRAWQFRRVVPGTTPAGDNIRDTVAQLAEDIGVRPPAVRLTSGAISPMIWSFGSRAQLLLPVALTEQLSPSELKTLLVHELAHIRRKDHWVRWIEIVALAVYWWHPVTWWARRRIEELEEECCDAWVLATMAGAAPTYARALLTTVEYVSGVQPVLPPLASGLGYVKFLKRRLTMIMHGPRSHRLSRPLWAAALGLAVLILPLSGKVLPASRAADDDEPAKAEPASGDGKSQDLDRRLRALESRMDRLLESLERGAKSENARVQDAERRLEEAKRRIAQERERVARALRQKEEMVRERRRSSDSNKDLDQLTEDLQKQIENAIHQAIDPKRLEQMEQQIQQTVREQLGSERMAAMGKQIEETVNRALSPEKIEAMERQIEEAINRNLKLEKFDRVRRERTREREPRLADAGQSSDSNADLERRVEKLEAKMDRLLEAVEKSQKH